MDLPRLIEELRQWLISNDERLRHIKYPKLLIKALIELNGVVGNSRVKDTISSQISHIIRKNSRAHVNPADNEMLNAVMYGPPGTGKTLIAMKLAKIWHALGCLNEPKRRIPKPLQIMGHNSSGDSDNTAIIWVVIAVVVILFYGFIILDMVYNSCGTAGLIVAVAILVIAIGIIAWVLWGAMGDSTPTSTQSNPPGVRNTEQDDMLTNVSETDLVKVVTRADFVGRYLGSTDKQTLELLEANVGKVLFVDEAYSLMNGPQDMYGMEALTTLNLFLSQRPKDIIVIFAGYKDQLEAGPFAVQPGLQSRFMWQFDCEGYTPDELFLIFNKRIKSKGWNLQEPEIIRGLFHQNKRLFRNYGRDCEKLAYYTEVENSRDYVNRVKIPENILTVDQVRRGMQKLSENDIAARPTVSTNPLVQMMNRLSKQPNESDVRSFLDQFGAPL